MPSIAPPRAARKPVRRDDLDGLEFPPNGRLDESSVAGLLLYAMTIGDGDPLEELIAGLGSQLQSLVDCPRGTTGDVIAQMVRCTEALGEIRRRELVQRRGNGVSK